MRRRPKNTRRSKFGVALTEAGKRARTFEGVIFDSIAERQRAQKLRIMERAGEISRLAFQPKFHLTRARILYKPDFFYFTKDGEQVVEDFKGAMTAVFNIKARLWKHYGTMPLLLSNKKGVFKEIRPIKTTK